MLPPATDARRLGYAEFAGWVPGGKQVLVARESRGPKGLKRSFEWSASTGRHRAAGSDPWVLGPVLRWQDPGWKRETVSMRDDAECFAQDRRPRSALALGARLRKLAIRKQGDTDGHALSPAEIALREAALEYHRAPTPGKISITPTKPLSNQRDLSLAYSPGVAEPCLAIEENPSLAAEYTARGNLVAVVTNGTAVLGLGNIGPLAGKPVMEGKGVPVQEVRRHRRVRHRARRDATPTSSSRSIAALEPTFGGINLEDIKAPECFYIEKKLRERMKIPVFHDDQHGTAIISGAALLNGLEARRQEASTRSSSSSPAPARRRSRASTLLVEPRRQAREHLRRRHRRA